MPESISCLSITFFKWVPCHNYLVLVSLIPIPAVGGVNHIVLDHDYFEDNRHWISI